MLTNIDPSTTQLILLSRKLLLFQQANAIKSFSNLSFLIYIWWWWLHVSSFTFGWEGSACLKLDPFVVDYSWCWQKSNRNLETQFSFSKSSICITFRLPLQLLRWFKYSCEEKVSSNQTRINRNSTDDQIIVILPSAKIVFIPTFAFVILTLMVTGKLFSLWRPEANHIALHCKREARNK